MAIKVVMNVDGYEGYRTEDLDKDGNLKPGAVTARADRPAQAIADLRLKLDKENDEDYHC